MVVQHLGGHLDLRWQPSFLPTMFSSIFDGIVCAGLNTMNAFPIKEFCLRTISSDKYFNQLTELSLSPLVFLRDGTDHH